MLPSPRSLRATGGRGSSWSSSIRGASGGEFIVVVEVFARWARLTGRLLAVIGEMAQIESSQCDWHVIVSDQLDFGLARPVGAPRADSAAISSRGLLGFGDATVDCS